MEVVACNASINLNVAPPWVSQHHRNAIRRRNFNRNSVHHDFMSIDHSDKAASVVPRRKRIPTV